MLKATVAGCTLELHGCDGMRHADKLREFPAVGSEDRCCIRVERQVPFCCPKETPTMFTERTRTFVHEDGRRTVYRADHKLSMDYDLSFSDVTVKMSPQTVNEEVRRYLSVLQVFSYHLLSKNASVLHSAGLVFENKGLALAGRAQVGKSTMARRLKALAPQTEILCEDAPAVWLRDGKPFLCGTPFCGDDEACVNREVPLGGIVVLQQGASNRLTALSPKEALYHLFMTVPHPPFDEDVAQRAISLVTAWIEAVPVWLFENDGSDTAAKCLSEALERYGWLAERTMDL